MAANKYESPIEEVRINFRVFHGKYIFFPSETRLEKFETLSLLGKNNHPIFDRPFTQEEKDYIQFYIETYQKYGIDFIPIESCINYYQELMRSGLAPTTNKYEEIGRRFMDIHHIQSHFKHFNITGNSLKMNLENIRYERDLAEKCLNIPDNYGSDHRWLLRHSSLNRPKSSKTPSEESSMPLLKSSMMISVENPWTEQFDLNTRLGRQYYVLSYRYDPYPIRHVLFGFYPGNGWAVMSTDNNNNVIIRSNWIPCFAQFLENLLLTHGLKFSTQIYSYYNISDSK